MSEIEGFLIHIVLTLINLGILIFVLVFYFRKPFREFIRQRRSIIKESMEKGIREKEESEKVYLEYREKLSKIDGYLRELRNEMLREANSVSKAIIQRAEDTSKKIREEAEKIVKEEIEKAGIRLKKDIIDLATLKAEKIIRESLTDEDTRSLLDEVLKSIEVKH